MSPAPRQPARWLKRATQTLRLGDAGTAAGEGDEGGQRTAVHVNEGDLQTALSKVRRHEGRTEGGARLDDGTLRKMRERLRTQPGARRIGEGTPGEIAAHVVAARALCGANDANDAARAEQRGGWVRAMVAMVMPALCRETRPTRKAGP